MQGLLHAPSTRPLGSEDHTSLQQGAGASSSCCSSSLRRFLPARWQHTPASTQVGHATLWPTLLLPASPARPSFSASLTAAQVAGCLPFRPACQILPLNLVQATGTHCRATPGHTAPAVAPNSRHYGPPQWWPCKPTPTITPHTSLITQQRNQRKLCPAAGAPAASHASLLSSNPQLTAPALRSWLQQTDSSAPGQQACWPEGSAAAVHTPPPARYTYRAAPSPPGPRQSIGNGTRCLGAVLGALIIAHPHHSPPTH